jgi:hypothetical protein
MVRTAPRGRSWLIREQMNRVVTTVATIAHAVLKKSKPSPTHRSTVRVRRKTTTPTPHAT